MRRVNFLNLYINDKNTFTFQIHVQNSINFYHKPLAPTLLKRWSVHLYYFWQIKWLWKDYCNNAPSTINVMMKGGKPSQILCCVCTHPG